MTVELYRHERLAPTRAWVALSPEERRRRAVAAVVDHTVPVLLDLLTAHHVRTHGHVSEETLRKYRLGASTGSLLRGMAPSTSCTRSPRTPTYGYERWNRPGKALPASA